MGNDRRRMLLWGMVMPAVMAAGCRTINRGITESVLERGVSEQWQVHYGSRIVYTLTNDTLTDVRFEGSTLAGDVVVRYQWGLGPQAQCIADRTADLLNRVSARTGVPISTRTTVYLLRFDQQPQNFDIVLAVEPNEFPLPLFVQAGADSCDDIIAQNHGYPYLAVHELTETSLASGSDGQVLPDLSWGLLGLNIYINNYTRWFRDGLANYAGYIAYEIVAREIPGAQRLLYRQTLLHMNPFTALAEVGDKLFRWPQLPARRQEDTYYSAALGLFLLIADTCGEQTIHYMLDEIHRRRTVDGRDLLEITNRVLGTDVKRLAADFKFPAVGVELERMTPALALNHGVDLREGMLVRAVKKGGAAQRAGLKEKDVITAVGSTPVANSLDFELGLFRARRRPCASLTIHRQGAGTLTLELPIEMPGSAQAAPPEERRKPLERGQVEVNYTIPAPTP